MYQLKANHMKNSITLESPQWLADFDRGQERQSTQQQGEREAREGRRVQGRKIET